MALTTPYPAQTNPKYPNFSNALLQDIPNFRTFALSQISQPLPYISQIYPTYPNRTFALFKTCSKLVQKSDALVQNYVGFLILFVINGAWRVVGVQNVFQSVHNPVQNYVGFVQNYVGYAHFSLIFNKATWDKNVHLGIWLR